tara:strand:- start:1333 stop:1575 length:243 start_codon:yes stop_codon:yes gene_type:complete
MSEEEVKDEETLGSGFDDLTYTDLTGAYVIGIFAMFICSKLLAWSAGTASMTIEQLSLLMMGGAVLVLVGLATGRMRLWD